MSKKNNSPQGRSWEDFRKGLLTPEERAESALRVELMAALTEARQENCKTLECKYMECPLADGVYLIRGGVTTKDHCMIRLTIDKKSVSVEEGATILDAARLAGADIPTLCYYKGIEPCVSCFVCVVKVDGRENLVPSCATAAEEGMVVDTCSEEVRDCRKRAIELMIKCLRCDCGKGDACRLRVYAAEYKARRGLYVDDNKREYARYEYDSGLVHEPDRCIVCGKCVGITRARGVKPGLAFSGRGANVRVVAPFGTAFDEAMGEAMEECVRECPTWALRIREKYNRPV